MTGAVETLKRVVDVLDYLWSRGKLGEVEYNAALRYQAAWDCLQSSIGGAMDFERWVVRWHRSIYRPRPR